MILQSAKQFLVQEQLDWNRPRLNWLPGKLYRLCQEAHPILEAEEVGTAVAAPSNKPT
ncbi:MAG: hypothetical protein AAF636_10530 [Pseudomonadota bacterium]